MRIINDYHTTDPYFNLAAEEYFLTKKEEYICRIWQNENTVVIGKHQAMPAEVNTKVASTQGVKIARRISGGGTVFHDLGNLNFTFISNNADGKNRIDFKQFTQPIIDALSELGLDIEHSGRNDLLLDEFKISGNAEHLSQKLKRTLHHGTLLFNSNLSNLGAILKTPIDQFEGKFVHSKRSRVTNILPYLNNPMSMQMFRNHLEQHFVENKMAYVKPLEHIEIREIEKLALNKYSQPEWIMGYSPRFRFNGSFEGKQIQVSVEKGRVIEVKGNLEEIALFESIVKGEYFNYSSMMEAIRISSDDKSKWTLVCEALFSAKVN